MNLEELEKIASTCSLCDLHKGRKKAVFAKGNPKSSILVCGMVPAKEENELGKPFVGRSGKLLDKVIVDLGISYNDLYITNLVKCFLAAGKPLNSEIIYTCFPYLLAQIFFIKPKIVISLGKDASFTLLGLTKGSLGSVRGQIHTLDGLNILPTYHPSYILRKGGMVSKEYKILVDDFKLGMSFLK